MPTQNSPICIHILKFRPAPLPIGAHRDGTGWNSLLKLPEATLDRRSMIGLQSLSYRELPVDWTEKACA